MRKIDDRMIALVADTHWGARSDSPVFLDHMATFFRETFFPKLTERGIRTIFHLGDLLDRRKFVNFLTLQKMRESFFDVAEELNINIHIILGNHDIYYKSSIDINCLDGLLGQYNNVTIYKDLEEIELCGGKKVLICPWIGDNEQDKIYNRLSEFDSCYIFGHLEVKGFEMYKGLKNLDRGADATRFKQFQRVFTGHFHHRSDVGNIVYIGAPYQIIWSDSGCDRGFAVFDVQRGYYEFINNPISIFEKWIYNEQDGTERPTAEQIANRFVQVKIVNKKDQSTFTRFIEELYEFGPADLSIIDESEQTILSENIDLGEVQDTLSVIRKTIDSLDTQVDKNKLFMLLSGFYHDSIGQTT